MTKITVQKTDVTILKINDTDYISLTDIAKYKTTDANAVIANWLRNRMTNEYLGLWEILYNPKFKPLEFEGFRKEAGLNAFTLSPQKWIETTGAIGIISKSGIQMRHIILFFRQKNIRTKKKHGNRKFDKSYYPMCL